MALDPNIILQIGKGVTPLMSPAEIQDQQMQREIGAYKLNALRQQTADDAAYRNILASGSDDLPNKLIKAGLGKQAQEYQKFQTEQQKAKLDAETGQLKNAGTKFDLIGQVLGGVKDQASYEQGVKQLNAMGIPTPQAPAQYDPAVVQQFWQQAVSAKDRLTAETARRGQDMTQSTAIRGQDLSAATSRANNANTVAATDRATDQRAAAAKAAAEQKAATKPLSPAALKMQQESLDAIGTASSINADLVGLANQIDSGKLKFGPMSNFANSALNATGLSTEESRNFASFKSTLEKLRNDSLRLNKGVQTEGDAVRAWNELFQNINDTKLVRQRLDEVKALNDRAVQLRKLDVDTIRSNFNQDPMDYSKFTDQKAAVGQTEGPKAKSKTVKIGNTDMTADLAPDGNYYVQQNGKWFRVKE